MVVAPIPLGPFLDLLHQSARRLSTHLIVILIAREADCPWLFAEIDRDWASIHDSTGNNIIMVTIDGETHLPLSKDGYSFNLRDDVGALRGGYGLVAFSPGSRLMNQLQDDNLDCRQTADWNEHPDEAFFARFTHPKTYSRAWRDNHSLSISSAVAALPGITERMLPCLRIDLVQSDHSFVLQLRPDPPESDDSVYRALRRVMIEGEPLLARIKACGKVLRVQGAPPRKVASVANSIQWVKDWTTARSDLQPSVQNFLNAALEGDASTEAVLCNIAPLRDVIDSASFRSLRGHLNRLAALSALIPHAISISDKPNVQSECEKRCREFETIVRRIFQHQTVQGGEVDPISMITLISSGLKLVDQFRELAIRFKGQAPQPPSGKAEQVGTALEVRHGSQVDQRIEASQLHLDQWDAVRYEALNKRIRTQWGIYNDLFADEAGAGIQERARVRADLRNIQSELCRDFKEMIQLYERALGTSLPDHYQLYEVCQ
jgi:hypothetical protein